MLTPTFLLMLPIKASYLYILAADLHGLPESTTGKTIFLKIEIMLARLS